MESSDVVILGGGFAGLACATRLAEARARVTLLEKRPHLGGRAYSFVDPRLGCAVDNGQHLFMGCYRHTRAFLRRIGTESLLHFPERVRIDYADALGRHDSLRLPGWLAPPFHLAAGVLGLGGLSWRDKAALRNLDRAMRRLSDGENPGDLDALTVRQWLNSLGQPRSLQERLLDPIAVGALNELPENASALGFFQVMRELFYCDAEATRLGFPTVGLSELYTGQACRFIEDRGGCVLTQQSVAALVGDWGGVREARTEGAGCYRAQAFVSAVPPWALGRVQRPKSVEGPWLSWKPAPIVGINLWLDSIVIDKPMIGLLGTQLHWVFDKTRLWGLDASRGQYLSLVISGAHRQIGFSPQELLELSVRDLSCCFPAFEKAKIRAWSVVKEPYATPSPVCGSDAWRPAHKSAVSNLYLAGDWTQTGLPATIESATASGHACAELILGGSSHD